MIKLDDVLKNYARFGEEQAALQFLDPLLRFTLNLLNSKDADHAYIVTKASCRDNPVLGIILEEMRGLSDSQIREKYTERFPSVVRDKGLCGNVLLVPNVLRSNRHSKLHEKESSYTATFASYSGSPRDFGMSTLTLWTPDEVTGAVKALYRVDEQAVVVPLNTIIPSKPGVQIKYNLYLTE